MELLSCLWKFPGRVGPWDLRFWSTSISLSRAAKVGLVKELSFMEYLLYAMNILYITWWPKFVS